MAYGNAPYAVQRMPVALILVYRRSPLRLSVTASFTRIRLEELEHEWQTHPRGSGIHSRLARTEQLATALTHASSLACLSTVLNLATQLQNLRASLSHLSRTIGRQPLSIKTLQDSMATLNNAEKGHGTLPRRLTSMQVADGVDNPDQYTLKKYPWRLRVTPFPHILRQVSLFWLAALH